ncbi:MAG TPA: PEP/pyruvate-binding domain-containing protein [Ktedonobacterales bacterium]|nr:PEP/pyruvate-binding domain-containing protein [Ktedonobacterales bacterium]
MSDAAWVRWLDQTDESDDQERQIALIGGKAANLGRLLRLGFPVPPAFVITTAAYRAFLAANDLEGLAATDPASLRARITAAPLPDDLSAAILAAYQRLGVERVAVRSSGTAEDLDSASFAGQHDTFLNVSGPDALLSAARACWASLWAPRAVAYREQRGWDAAPLALAVIVQAMVPAAAAGVAFTADPVAGDRTQTTISAVRGLGERLVSGEGAADEWVARESEAGGEATLARGAEGALTAEQALSIAALARRIERGFGAPQDVEWAIDGEGQLFALQARPMTALPAPATSVEWRAPLPGGWMRNFRLGEWLPEPVTPLCDTWLLNDIEEAEFAAQGRDIGARPRPPYHVTVHGWYFSSPIGAGMPIRRLLGALLRHPLHVLSIPLSLIRPEFSDRVLLARMAERWRAELLPAYQRLVAAWQERVAGASADELTRLIDEIAAAAGEQLWSLSAVGGHAWKTERALAAFYQKRLVARVRRSHQELLRGLPTPFPDPPPHAVQSLDWIRPTLGEEPRPASLSPGAPDASNARRLRLETERRAAEAACRAALASQPRLLRRFNALLALAQRYAILREEQSGWFTLGWPLLRLAVARLGAALRDRGVIAQPDDVFFLTRAELQAGLAGDAHDLRAVAPERRREWAWRRRLSPPLALGNPPGEALIAGAVNVMRMPGVARQDGAETLRGMPASPGQATGLARVLRGPEDFGRFLPGEVLVTQATAPAWTPLFALAAAVVTDGGSLAAHASLVAREYGIPAVVGTGNATTRLRDGQRVLVDGDRGSVALLDAEEAGAKAVAGQWRGALASHDPPQ